jgi:hypothetical protein
LNGEIVKGDYEKVQSLFKNYLSVSRFDLAAMKMCLSNGLQLHEEGDKSLCRPFNYGPSTNVSSSSSSEKKPSNGYQEAVRRINGPQEKEPYIEE